MSVLFTRRGMPPAATFFTFTIDDVSYQADEGMTWGEWIESAYNTGGFENDEYIGVWDPDTTKNICYLLDDGSVGDFVEMDFVISDPAYVTSFGGGLM